MKISNELNFWQVDNQIKCINELNGTVILPTSKAWDRYSWVRKFFKDKPMEGYFIWVKNQPQKPITTCITIQKSHIKQNLGNLLVIENGIQAKTNVLCNAVHFNLNSAHYALGKVVLKDGASLEYEHQHIWGKEDQVFPNYQFFLGKNSKLIYNYKNLFPPKKLEIENLITQKEKSSSNINILISGINSKIKINEGVIQRGNNAKSIIRLRLVAKKNTKIQSESYILAKSESQGHLDCQGLLVDKKSEIILMPKLICQNKFAQLTHEASLGRISEEQLTYLRQRGLTEKEAIDLIIGGFLGL